MSEKRLIVQALILSILWAGVASPLRADLVGYWGFDGNTDDQSDAGNHGELNGGAYVNSVPDVIGAGQALSFEDPLDHVFVEANESLNSSRFTWSMFVNDQEQFEAINRLASREGDSFEMGIDKVFGTDSLSYYSPSNGWTTTGAVLDTDQWHHLAYVADGESMTVYLDGEDVFGPQPFFAAPTGFLHLGNRHNDVEGFFGILDEVALWSDALPASSIADLASGAKSPLQIPIPEEPVPPPEPFLTVGSSVDAWQLSTEFISGGEPGDWDPSDDPPPPAANTFTLEPLPTEPGVIGGIHSAATRLDVEGLLADNDTYYYRTTFELDRNAGFSAEIQLAVDNGAQVYINGELVATEVSFLVENWSGQLPSISIGEDGSVETVKFDDQADSFTNWNLGENEVLLAIRNPSSEGIPAGGFAFRLDFFGEGTLGDFNGNGQLDVEDIDLLTMESASGSDTPSFDLNGDQRVNVDDVNVWVRDLRNTWIGDANVDGEFNSSDFVAVFQAGKFENLLPAKWSEGDWNGDGLFNSTDFVAAFQDGGFEQGPRPENAVIAVPEPSAAILLSLGVVGIVRRRRP